MLILLVANWTDVLADVAEVYSATHEACISPVILYVAIAVSALWSLNFRPPELSGFSLRKIKERIVGRVKVPRTWKSIFHRDRYPVPKSQLIAEHVCTFESPTRKVTHVERTTSLQNVH